MALTLSMKCFLAFLSPLIPSIHSNYKRAVTAFPLALGLMFCFLCPFCQFCVCLYASGWSFPTPGITWRVSQVFIALAVNLLSLSTWQHVVVRLPSAVFVVYSHLTTYSTHSSCHQTTPYTDLMTHTLYFLCSYLTLLALSFVNILLII